MPLGEEFAGAETPSPGGTRRPFEPGSATGGPKMGATIEFPEIKISPAVREEHINNARQAIDFIEDLEFDSGKERRYGRVEET